MEDGKNIQIFFHVYKYDHRVIVTVLSHELILPISKAFLIYYHLEITRDKCAIYSLYAFLTRVITCNCSFRSTLFPCNSTPFKGMI